MVLHLRPTRLPRLDPDRSAKIIGLHRADVSHLSLMEAPNEFPMTIRVAHGEARHDGEILPARVRAGGQNAPNAGGIDGHRLFSKHMLARGDSGFEMHRTKVRRGGQKNYHPLR